MNALALAVRQVKYENTAFWRNPVAAFFTFVFPLMFLVIFNLLFGNDELDLPGGTANTSTFYVPAIAAFSVISACYTNVAINVSMSRDRGLLKRTRGTPLPGWSFLFGRIVHATLLAILLVAIVVVAGVLFYDVDAPSNALPAFLVSLAVGAATFCALGLAITSIIPNADASPAIVNATILPLLFISDVFIPLQDAPAWLTTVADIFPVRHFSLARIHRRTSLGTALEEASGCSSESGIMVLEQKPARKQGAPNRCCHRTNPTVSASSLTTIAWWPMPACSCRPP